MVFGLSSSKPLWLTSDHLPSASNLSQSDRKKRDEGITQLISQNEQNDLKKTPIILSKNSKWRRHGHKENRDHHQRDHQFADHSTEISQQTPPACPAGVDHSFAGNEFSQDRANHRSNKQADDSEKDADECAKNSAKHPPFCRSKISGAKVTAQKIERICREGQEYKNDNGPPTDTFLWAEHDAVNDRRGQNDRRSR